mgnify:CR=1 FL=1
MPGRVKNTLSFGRREHVEPKLIEACELPDGVASHSMLAIALPMVFCGILFGVLAYATASLTPAIIALLLTDSAASRRTHRAAMSGVSVRAADSS